MATTVVRTPVKSHSNIFSTKAAGGRIPLTPSPRGSRKSPNASPFTPPPRRRHDPSWHAEPPRKSNLFPEPSRPGVSLTAAFASLDVSGSKSGSMPSRSARAVSSPKSNIARSNASPLRLDLGVSDWALTGTGTTSGQNSVKRKTRSGVGKTTIRINGDRFIPTRGASSPTASTKIEHNSRPGTGHGRSNSVLSGGAFGQDNDEASNTATGEDSQEIYKRPDTGSLEYQSSIAAACGVNLTTRILAFKPAAPESSRPIDLRSLYNRPLKPAAAAAQFRRRILTAPERVLDAPGLVDDYYLNLLDWSINNQVAIGLERSVYVWNADTGNVSMLCESSPDTYVTSVKWSSDGAYVALGLDCGDVQIWDVEDSTKLRTMTGHESRVGVMSWNKAILSTGSRSGSIFNHDVRIAEHKAAELLSHTSEVCGLEWRSDGAQLASGGNDNLVNIWDARSIQTPKWTKTNHRAAVKALAWCPWQLNLLATGGGNYDRCIHFWNSTTGARVNSIDTDSQVTSLKWSTNYRELVSCHGMPDNQLNIWSYPSLVRNVEIPAHETRILHSALSPDGQTLATCASDENLKFWKLFEKRPGSSGSAREASGITGKGDSRMAQQMTIR